MRKMVFEVTINAPDDESVNGIRAYMREAIASWSGQFSPDDSLFGHFHSKAGYKNISIKYIASAEKGV